MTEHSVTYISLGYLQKRFALMLTIFAELKIDTESAFTNPQT